MELCNKRELTTGGGGGAVGKIHKFMFIPVLTMRGVCC